jgi:plasmid maintenance system antidote protein VapI
MARKLTEQGFKLKIKLLNENKSQSWFASQLGISRQQLTNVIYGEGNLRLELAIDKYIEEGLIDDTYNNQQRPS